MEIRSSSLWGVGALLLLAQACQEPPVQNAKTIEERLKVIDLQIAVKQKQLDSLPVLIQKSWVCGNDYDQAERGIASARSDLEAMRKAGNVAGIAKAEETLKKAESNMKNLEVWAKKRTQILLDGLKRMGYEAKDWDDFTKIINQIKTDIAQLQDERNQLQVPVNH